MFCEPCNNYSPGVAELLSLDQGQAEWAVASNTATRDTSGKSLMGCLRPSELSFQKEQTWKVPLIAH